MATKPQQAKSMLRLPIAPSLYSVDSTCANTKHSSQLGNAGTSTKHSAYEYYMSLVKYSASIPATFVGLVLYRVIDVFVRSSVAQVRRRVIVSVTIYMANYHTRWAGSGKRLGYNTMDTFRCLGLISQPLLKRYRQVVRSSVRLSDKPFAMLDGRNPTEVTNFVPIMARYGFPKFGSIYHG